jgi:hypothetical protein
LIKRYTVDKIIDKRFAVLLEREDESKRLDIPLRDIPAKIKEGDILDLEQKQGKIVFAEIDREATKNARKEVEKILKDIKSKGIRDLKWH